MAPPFTESSNKSNDKWWNQVYRLLQHFPAVIYTLVPRFKLKFNLKCLQLWAEQKKRDTAKDPLHTAMRRMCIIVSLLPLFRVRICFLSCPCACPLAPWLAVCRLFMFSLTVQNIWPVWSRWKLCNQWINCTPTKLFVSRIIPLGCLPWPVCDPIVGLLGQGLSHRIQLWEVLPY